MKKEGMEEESNRGTPAEDITEENANEVQRLIKELGYENISDEQLDKELDQLLTEYPHGTPFNKIMGEARRRFLNRKDLDVVALHLAERMKKL